MAAKAGVAHEARIRQAARPQCLSRRGRGGRTEALIAGPYTFTLDGLDLVDQAAGVRIDYAGSGGWVINLPLHERVWHDAKDAAEHLARTYHPLTRERFPADDRPAVPRHD